MRLKSLLGLVVALGVVSFLGAPAAFASSNLVTNGSFETGDFTGWGGDQAALLWYRVPSMITPVPRTATITPSWALQCRRRSSQPDNQRRCRSNTMSQAPAGPSGCAPVRPSRSKRRPTTVTAGFRSTLSPPSPPSSSTSTKRL